MAFPNSLPAFDTSRIKIKMKNETVFSDVNRTEEKKIDAKSHSWVESSKLLGSFECEWFLWVNLWQSHRHISVARHLYWLNKTYPLTRRCCSWKGFNLVITNAILISLFPLAAITPALGCCRSVWALAQISSACNTTTIINHLFVATASGWRMHAK